MRRASEAATAPAVPAVRVESLTREFPVRGGTRRALVDVSFTVAPGGTLAVVGESGAGKSTLVKLVAGLDRPTRGRVLVAGAPPRVRPGAVSPVQMVFQNATDAFNPLLSVGESVGEPLRGLGRVARRARVAELVEQVGLEPARLSQRPSRFSGGQLQRLGIARALAASPEVLLCDEPTSALDVSVQAQILNLLLSLQERHGFACVLVTHDLTVARVLADEILVLRDGRAVAHATADGFFREQRDGYARSLMEAAASQTLSRAFAADSQTGILRDAAGRSAGRP